jgi:TetR/AcrR family transcriptional regulator
MTQVQTVEQIPDNRPAQAPRHGIAERLWEAARIEFSQRGYHGARVQGIARRAGCNVALLYRHWSSKKALYLDILRTVWQAQAREIVSLLERGTGPEVVVTAYVDALMRDPAGSQIVIRELLDGAPQLQQLVEAEPELIARTRAAVERIQAPSNNGSSALRPGLDPTMVVLTIGALAALVASVHDVARIWTGSPITGEAWREHLQKLLLHGIVP